MLFTGVAFVFPPNHEFVQGLFFYGSSVVQNIVKFK